MEERIRNVLKEKVDPVLAAHYGGAVLTEYNDGVAYVKLTGSCAACPSAQSTIEEVVKSIVTENIPEIKDVVLDDRIGEDLLDMARKILNIG
jgi:Fe-S cluster biogenesis protein NfuA